ncbi:MAG: metal ABC transporter permease [Syntrophotaleaceae bacterium]
MENFFDALFTQTFMQNALVGGLLAAVACGIAGAYVVVKRIGYMAGGIAHAVLGGMGLAYFLGRSPVTGAIITAIVAALIIGWVGLYWRQQEDTAISALWAVGMAAGVLLISATPGYTVDLMSYLFGNILMIPRENLYLIFGLDLAIVIFVVLFYKQLLAVSFDEEFAELRQVRVKLFSLLLLCLVALTVVILIQVVGLILVIALLALPAAIAGQFVHSLGKIMLVAMALGALFTTGGLAFSYQYDLPSGAATVLLTGLVYLLAIIGQAVWNKLQVDRRVKGEG